MGWLPRGPGALLEGFRKRSAASWHGVLEAPRARRV